MPPAQISLTRPWSVTWDVQFLKNFLANWSTSTSRIWPTISLFRNARHRTINYVLPQLTLAKSCHAYSLLSNLINNILLPTHKLLFLSLPPSPLFLMLMPWTWHTPSSLPKRKNAAALKTYTFIVVKLITKLFPALLSQLMNMSRPFKTFKTLQLPSLLQTVCRTWEKIVSE